MNNKNISNNQDRKMLKRIIVIALSMVLILNVAGCGITKDDFITTVRKYKIFDTNTMFKMQTVSDFEKEMESLNEDGSKFSTRIDISWKEEDEDPFIESLRDKEDFVYDKKKYYGSLRISVAIFSPADYSTEKTYADTYLFSLDKDGMVVPEAAAHCSDYKSYNYQDITTEPLSIQDSMNMCLLLTKALKEIYAE